MKTWQKIGALTLLMLAVLGIRIFFLWRERQEPGVQKEQPQRRALTDDDTVVPKKLFINDLKSAKELSGRTLWVQAGFELDYFPYTGHAIQFQQKKGVLPSVQKLTIKDVIVSKAPAGLKSRLTGGDKQVYAIFTMPDDPATYATPIGILQGSDSNYFCDDIFYYDDPHQMYKHWGPELWQAVDQHQPKKGMNELQVAMALGVVQQSDSSSYGNRAVHYDAGGKQWTVTFRNNQATDIQSS